MLYSTGMTTIPISYHIMLAFVAMFITLMVLLLFYLVIKTRNLLDRYRLKYTFDREIESKEIDNIKNLDTIEKAFKRRVFKD